MLESGHGTVRVQSGAQFKGSRGLSILALLFHPPMRAGGAEKRLSRIKGFWESWGCNIMTLEPTPQLIPGSIGINAIPNASGTWSKVLAGALWIVRSVVRGVRLRTPKIVLCANNDLFSVFPGFLLSRLLKTRLAVVVHHFDINENETGGRVRGLGPVYGWFKNMAVRLSIRMVRKADLVFCVNPYFRRIFPEARVTSNSVDLERFRKFSRQPPEYDGCFIGLLSREKRIRVLLDIWRQVAAERPTSKLALVGTDLIGVRRQIHQRGLERNVVYLGALDDEEVSRVFNTSKVFVTASVSEGWGIAIAEALASGLFVVCPSTQPLESVWASAKDVHLVEDQDSFAMKVLELIQKESQERVVELPALETWESLARSDLEGLYDLV